MAFADSADCQPGAFERAVGFDGLAGVSRAGRIKPALRAEKRRQQQAVAVDQEYQQGFH
jgi:hypothetical protein